MFNKEFYPTPVEVLDMMQIECTGKIVLEPQAGKADIVKYLNSHGALAVCCCEINPDLRAISSKYGEMIGEDFFDLTAEDISHIDMIVMNPPFSNADEHILHAWEIAPEGCEIISLLNMQTIWNAHTRTKARLKWTINDHGFDQNLGPVFGHAERETDAEIGLVKLFKPVIDDETKYDGFFMEEEPEDNHAEGIMKFNEVRATVNRYVRAAKMFDEVEDVITQINSLAVGDTAKISVHLGWNDRITSKEQYLKALQKSCWSHLFHKMNLDKYVTSGVMEDINKFVETQQKIPFSMQNVYRMFDIIWGTRENTLTKALEEVIDNFTRHTYVNRFQVEGWKTNAGHMLNKKFIVEYMVRPGYGVDSIELGYSSRPDKLEDLTKVLCNLTGRDYMSIPSLKQIFDRKDEDGNPIRVMRGTWYEWGFFRFKGFKKGTMHLEFINEDDWYVINQKYGELKGFSLYEATEKAA